MNKFSVPNDLTFLSLRRGLFLKTPSRELTWQDLQKKRHEPIATHSSLLGVVESDCAVKVFLSLWQHWSQGRAVLILDATLPTSRKQEILDLMAAHLTKDQQHSVFLLSSGTTGAQKIIGLDFTALCASAQMTQDFYGESFPDHWGLTLPVHHVGGLMILWRMFLSGGRVTNDSLQELLKQDINGLSLVPTQLQGLLAIKDAQKRLNQLRLILLGGAACSQLLYEKILENKLPVSLTYGSTETCSQVFATIPLNQELNPSKTPHVGQALGSVEILTPKQQDIKERLTLKTPTLFHALITQDGLEIFEKSRLYLTNDLALLNAKNQIEIHGRSDQVFISGGENVSPESVENRLKSCPGINDALIIARTDEKYGFVSHLFYDASDEDSSIRQRLRDYFQQELLPHERPKSMSRFPQELKTGLKLSRQKAQAWIQSRQSKEHPQVIFLHGFMGTMADFDPLIEQLIDLGATPWKLKALNLPGHAKIKIQAENFEDFLHELLQQNKKQFERPHILYGYSLGARVCFQLALKNPSSCLGLICEAGHFGLSHQEEMNQRLLLDCELFKPNANDEDFQSFLTKWYQLPLFYKLKDVPHFKATMKRRLTAHKREDLYHCLQVTSLGRQKTNPEMLKTLPFKTHYLSGEYDQKYTAYGRLLQEQDLVEHDIISQASHNIHQMNPNELAQKIIEIIGT